MTIQPNRFKDLIENTGEFVITCEHIPGRLPGGKKLDEIVEFAAKGVETGLVHALSLTDNPGGTPAISPDVIAQEVERAGMPAIVHFSAKDLNRNMLESRALGLARTGVRNLLVMSGDFQTLGQAGLPMPVFDLDPVHILALLNLMNRGKVIDPVTRELADNPAHRFLPRRGGVALQVHRGGHDAPVLQDGEEAPGRCALPYHPARLRQPQAP